MQRLPKLFYIEALFLYNYLFLISGGFAFMYLSPFCEKQTMGGTYIKLHKN